MDNEEATNMTPGNRRWTIPLADVDKTREKRMADFCSESLDYDARRQAFLEAWKFGVRLAGEAYFKITAESIEAANNKWQMQPDLLAIQDAIGRISAGQGAFLAAMYSFFNADDGQKLLTAAGYPNIADLAGKLEGEHAEVIAALFLH